MNQTSSSISAYRWVIAFAVLGLLLMLISKFRVGYTIIYYLVVLVLVFLILTQYQAISTLLSPFDSLPGGTKPNG